MKLYLVRHGETDNNVKKIIQGHSNSKLTKLGKKQAQLLAKRLSKVRLDYIYSSDLLRARKTTEEIAKHQNCPIKYCVALRERSMGKFSGRHRDEWRAYLENNKLFGKIHKRIPGNGESIYQLQKRIVNFFEKMCKKHANQTVLFSTHGGPKKFLMMYLNGFDLDEFTKYPITFENAGLSMVNVHIKGKHKVELENCVKHLK